MNNGQEQMREDDVEEKHLIFYVIGNSLEFPITQKGTFFYLDYQIRVSKGLHLSL